MALNENQIHSAIGSATNGTRTTATPYELKSLSTAPIQTVATLKNTFSKLNPNSITDYLTSIGEDPSIQNRQALGTKYGISNIGTAEGNTELLKALKGGAIPTPTIPQVGGSVAGASNPTDTTKLDNALTGTVAGANNTENSNTPVNDGSLESNPIVVQSKSDYTSKAKISSDLKKRIDDVNNTLDRTLQDKRDEIARSGGVVNESQLRSTVLAENAPLLQERRDLLAQYTQANSDTNMALKSYTDAQNNYYKNKNIEISQAKVDQSNEKMDIQQQQFEQKLEQTGWKSSKVNIYDPAGNVVGQKMVWTESPASSSANNKVQTTSTSSSGSGIAQTGTTSIGNVTKENPPKLTLADGASPQQVLNTLITGKPVYFKGSTTPSTQQDLYNWAIDLMLGIPLATGGRIPAGAVTAVNDKKTQIMNAYGLTEFDVGIAKNQFKSMTSANTQLLQTASFMNVYAGSAKDYIKLAIEQGDKVARSGSKLVNHFSQWLQGNFTPAGDLAEFETYIYTAGREYAKVTTGGAKSSAELSITAQQKVEELINASQSPEVFKQVTNAMIADMDKQVSNFDRKTSSFPNEVKALYGMATKPPQIMRTSVSDDKTFVEKSLTRQGYHYDALMTEMKANVPAGTQPALNNETGEPVYATQEDIKNGLATPL